MPKRKGGRIKQSKNLWKSREKKNNVGDLNGGGDASNLHVVCGSIHQNCLVISAMSRGNMCTASALVALCVASGVSPPVWTSETVDTVLKVGDQFYQVCIEMRRIYSPGVTSPHLAADEVTHDTCNTFLIFDYGIVRRCTEQWELAVYGYLGTTVHQLLSLTEGLIRFFDRASYGLFICASQTMALMKVTVSEDTFHYYMVDSHSRPNFFCVPNLRQPNAFLLRCTSVQELSKVLLDIHHFQPPLTYYAIHAIQIENVQDVPSDNFIFRTNINEIRTRRRTSARIEKEVVVKRKKNTRVSDVVVESSYLGKMDTVCNFCNALKFKSETALNCCKKGQVRLPTLGNYPDYFKALLTGDHPNSKEFVKYIRAYNSNIAMASVSANYVVPEGRGPPIIKISGIFHHGIGDVSRNNPRFGSVYICAGSCDSSCDNPRLSKPLLAQLRHTLREINPFVGLYKQMGELIDDSAQQPVEELYINFFLNPTTDRRRFNAPTDPNEIGAVFGSRDGLVPPNDIDGLRVYYRDVSSSRNNYGIKYISRISTISDPLCYPLLFPNGELGWSINILLCSPKGKKRIRITMCEFYCYRLQIRMNEFNPMLSAGKLTQQFITDSYVNIESDRFSFFENDEIKTTLRISDYDGLVDYINRREGNNCDEPVEIGRMHVLPSTFQGGHRFMVGNYQDSMTMIAKFGKPTFFITMTSNPRWREISENLGEKQIPSDRPDLIVRVFHEKLKLLMRDLTENAMFGKAISWVYVVEFQKRGLPHAHISLTIDESESPKTADDVDKFISAELPDKIVHPDLHQTVLDLMVHGPCGDMNPRSPCMEEGKCKKQFPFSFTERTVISDGHITYMRRHSDNAPVSIKNHVVDNRWIIPYNPQLLLKYRSHINVLYVANVGCVKYLFKYITKGHDAALYRLQDHRLNADGETILLHDEIAEYVQSRYISACEAAYRIFKMSLVSKSHSVVRLPIHLPNKKIVYFNQNDNFSTVTDKAERQVSMLEEYFKLNTTDEFARTLYYVDVPEYYVYRNNTWQRRQRTSKTIGRIHSVNPRQTELFHLRILLLHVKGATSYEDLLNPRDGNPVICTSFHEAARRRILIGADDLEWERTLEECCRTQVAGQTRKIFCYLLNFCDIIQPRVLYDKFREHLFEDYLRRRMSEYESEKKCLLRMENFMNWMNTSLLQHNFADLFARFNLGEGTIDAEQANYENDDENLNETAYDWEGVRKLKLLEEVAHEVALFNTQQKNVFDRLWESIDGPEDIPKCFYLQGAGGTGKTFLYNVLLKALEFSEISYLAVAHTGIAATLLRGGRTAHSTFRLPLDIHEQSSSGMSIGSNEADRLKRAKLIVWDEISMTSHFTLDVVDRLLRQIHGRESVPFGGVSVLLGGDLRQLLPVNRHSTAQMEHTFINCLAWPHFQVFELTENMRADRDATDFANWLLELGDGTLQVPSPLREQLPPGSIEIPKRCISRDVVNDIYGDIFNMCEKDRCQILSERMVLCSLNRTCDAINDRMIDKFPGESFFSFSVDTIETDDVNDKIKYQEEVLNSRDHSGMPRHLLKLKVGVPIILLRNISLEDGLVNGTRMITKSMSAFLLTAEIVSGAHRGQVHSIPRMDLTSRDPHFPFTLKRRQFPVRVCFAMTINKSQGQTFQRVGICLPYPVFAHGQLYVAFSRTVNFNSVRVQIETTSVQGRLIPGNPRVFTRNLAPVELLLRLRQQQQLCNREQL